MKYQTQTMTLNIPAHNNETLSVPVAEQAKTTKTRSEVHLGEKIGEGGMGAVFLAHQDIINRKVAVKRLKANSRQRVSALIEEAQITGQLEHPNIIPIHSVQIDDANEPEVVMKYIQGSTFSNKISDEPSDQEIRDNLQVILQICYPLEFAHNQNIIHRDIKPENIMLGTFGEVYLLDWGLALDLEKADQTIAGLVGTPAYMAPEMTKGDPKLLTPATDIYLLGACLHQVLTGKPRHEGKTLQEALGHARRSKPYLYPKGIRSIIGYIANKACDSHVNLRYRNIQEFRTALTQIFDRWDAIQLTQTAETLLEELKTMLHIEEPDPFLVHAVFNKARFAFEQSLTLFPNNHEAKKGIAQTIFTMTQIMLRLGQASYAQQLLHEAEEKDPALQNEIRSAMAAQEQKKYAQHIREEKMQQYDPKGSMSYRNPLSFRLLCLHIFFFAISLGYFVLETVFFESYLLTVYSVCALVVLSIQNLLSKSNIRNNTIAKQISAILFANHAGVLIISMLPSWSDNNLDPYILSSCVMGMMSVALYPTFHKGIWLIFIIAGILFLPIPSLVCFYLVGTLCYSFLFFEWNYRSAQS